MADLKKYYELDERGIGNQGLSEEERQRGIRLTGEAIRAHKAKEKAKAWKNKKATSKSTNEKNHS